MNFSKVCNERFELQNEYPDSNKLINQTHPVVSVAVATYQHVNYIKQCLDGILMQITSFPIEIIVGEDESTDGTREICIEYADKHPDKIRLFLRDRRLSQLYDEKGKYIGFFNSLWNRMSCRGQYIALCEGDDYWTDPYKLQKQVDFLQANSEFSFCFHDAEVRNQHTASCVLRVGMRPIDTVVDLKSVVIQNNIATASLVFRNTLDAKNPPEWVSKTVKGDYALVVLLAEKGLGKFMPELMSVYRVHDGGVWSGNKTPGYHSKEDIKFYSLLEEYFNDEELKKAIRQKRAYSYYNLGIAYLRNGHLIKGFWLAIRYLGLRRDARLKSSPVKILSALQSGLKTLLKAH